MNGVRRWFRLGDVERDVDEEIALYFEEMVRDLVAAGQSEESARAEAARRFGDARAYRSQLVTIDRRVARRLRWRARVGAVRDTVVHAGRSVARTPALALGVVIAFALGIGANATMYATVERLLLRPPPHISNPDGVRRLMVERETGFAGRITTVGITFPDYIDFTRASGFSHVAAQASRRVIVGEGESAQETSALLVTASWWPLLGVEPALGRFFSEEEDRLGGAPVAVLSYAYWQREHAGRRDVIGRTIDFGHGPFTIIGVTPRGFTGIDLAPVDVFLPFMTTAERLQGTEWVDSRGWYWLESIARVRDGVALETAAAEATSQHRAGREGDPNYDPQVQVIAAPLLRARGPNAPSEVAVAQWLLGVAVVVLLIACLNVANLLLARMIRQRREIAVRLALGITRTRLIAQIVMEGVILGIAGGVAALALAHWGGTYVQRTLLPDVDWSSGVSGTVVAIVFALALLAGVISALIPAWQASRRHVVEGLRYTGGATRSTARVRATLSVVQAALSVILLIGAGLFVRSLDNVRHGDYGIDPWNVAYISVSFSGGPLPPPERMEYYRRALERIGRNPEIEAVTMAGGVPFWSVYATSLRVPGVDSIPTTPAGGPYTNSVTADYFRVLDLRAVRGRVFDERDTRTSEPAVVISESFARALWPERDAIGQCIHINDGPCARVIGVVEDASAGRLIGEVTYQLYVLFDQQLMPRAPDGILVRPATPAVMEAVQRELVATDARARFARARTLEEMIAPQMRTWELGATMFSLFGVLALIVAAIGLYSVLAFDVAQRVREIGLRTALGATTSAIVRLVLSRAVSITAVGVLLGAVAALVLAPRVQSMLHGVSARDPVTFLIVIGTLGAVAIAASCLPAIRAARVDPNEALRAE